VRKKKGLKWPRFDLDMGYVQEKNQMSLSGLIALLQQMHSLTIIFFFLFV